MSVEDLEAEALKLDTKSRARLAERLLQSLENLSEDESAALWAAEAERRDRDWERNAVRRPAAEVLKDARARIR